MRLSLPTSSSPLARPRSKEPVGGWVDEEVGLDEWMVVGGRVEGL